MTKSNISCPAHAQFSYLFSPAGPYKYNSFKALLLYSICQNNVPVAPKRGFYKYYSFD